MQNNLPLLILGLDNIPNNIQKKRDTFKMNTPFLFIGRQKKNNGLILGQILRGKLHMEAKGRNEAEELQIHRKSYKHILRVKC